MRSHRNRRVGFLRRLTRGRSLVTDRDYLAVLGAIQIPDDIRAPVAVSNDSKLNHDPQAPRLGFERSLQISFNEKLNLGSELEGRKRQRETVKEEQKTVC